MKKLSIIRGEEVRPCPYGLDIINACETIGNAILTMQPLEYADENNIKEVIKKNKIIYLTQQAGERCIFANAIMKKFNTIDCSYGDSASGEGTHYLTPSPLYPKNFMGDNVNPSVREDRRGVNITDPRLYYEEPQRGIDVPFGLFSVFSSKSNELGIIRVAEKYTNKIPNIKDKLNLLRDKYFDALKIIIPNDSIIKLNDKQLEELLLVIDDWAR